MRNMAGPLIWAAINNQNPEVITLLLKAGADAKVKDSQGMTAFFYAQLNKKLTGTDALKQLEEASK
jgi:ankyrin repeat protein